MILEERDLCVLSMWENIRCIIMTRFYEKLKEASEKWEGMICPKIRQKVRKNTDFAANCAAIPAPVKGMGVFEVMSNQKHYIVELRKRSCSCRRWQLTGIPCCHAISSLRHERVRTALMVASCYKLTTFVQAYNCDIYPVGDRSEWPKTHGPDILPPYYEKKCGRPKKSRRKTPEELAEGTKLSKHGVKMHCGYCRNPSHTKRNCIKYKEDIAAEMGQGGAQMGQAAHNQQPAAQEDQPGPEEQPTVKPKISRRKRTPSLKVREQQEADKAYEQLRKKAKTFDENGDIDDPSILQVSAPHDPRILSFHCLFTCPFVLMRCIIPTTYQSKTPSAVS